MAKILIVDRRINNSGNSDEKKIYATNIAQDYLVSCYSNTPHIVGSVDEACEMICGENYDIVITHEKIPGSERLLHNSPSKVILLTDKYDEAKSRDLVYNGALSIVQTPINTYDFSLMLDRTGLRNESRKLVYQTDKDKLKKLIEEAKDDKEDIYAADSQDLALAILRTRKISEVIGGLEDQVSEAFEIYQTPIEKPIIIGFYGNPCVGKTTFENSALYITGRPCKIVSRPLRNSELQGIDTLSISPIEFEMLQSRDFIKFKRDNYFVGLNLQEVDSLLKKGSVVMSIPEPELLYSLYIRYPGQFIPLYLESSKNQIIERLLKRNQGVTESMFKIFRDNEYNGLTIKNPNIKNILKRELHFLEKHKIIRDSVF
jgi:guanylate kinase